MTLFQNAQVEAKFRAYPDWARARLMELRALIFEVAETTTGVGPLEETLKWGEPAYLTRQTGSGSLVRMDWKRRAPDQVSLFFHCQTNLVESFRAALGGSLRFEGNRAIVIKRNDAVETGKLAFCLASALTYNLKRKSGKKRVTPSHEDGN